METITQPEESTPSKNRPLATEKKKKTLNSLTSALMRAALGTLFLVVALIATMEGWVVGLTLLSLVFLFVLVIYMRSETASALLIDPEEIKRSRKTRALERFISKMEDKNVELETQSLEGEALKKKDRQMTLLSKQIETANKVLNKIN